MKFGLEINEFDWPAAAMRQIPIGTLVTGVTYRYPAILVKQATTLDVLSGGRSTSASVRRGTSVSTQP